MLLIHCSLSVKEWKFELFDSVVPATDRFNFQITYLLFNRIYCGVILRDPGTVGWAISPGPTDCPWVSEDVVEYAWIGLTAVDDLILTSQPALASSLHVDLLFTKVSLVNFQISLSKI